jgi:hypothetical protein
VSAEVKRIKCFGHYYHVIEGKSSKNVKERMWKKECCKRWGIEYSIFSGDWHHPAGRKGILRYMIENSCPVTRERHNQEKSLNFELRTDFQRWVRLKVGGTLYDRLLVIKNHIERINPKYQGDV